MLLNNDIPSTAKFPRFVQIRQLPATKSYAAELDLEIPKDVPKNLEEIVFTETKRTWQGLLFAHRGKVVNRPQAEFAANNKIDQLLFARGHPKSVQIPDTLLTNNPGALRRFYREHDQICHKLQRVLGQHHL